MRLKTPGVKTLPRRPSRRRAHLYFVGEMKVLRKTTASG
jgi:hypothetical protein